MARIVKSACPECGASIQFDAEGDQAKCDYCGAIARIERSKPPRQPDAQRQGGPVVYAPKAVSGAIVAVIVITTIVPVVIGIAVAIAATTSAVSSVTAGPGAGGSTGQGLTEHMQWQGNRRVMLADLNGDGVLDPIGWIRFLDGSASNDHIGAFDATTGKRLWLTPPLVDGSQSYNAKAALAGDKLVVADPAGALRAFSLANGQLVWSAVLGERAERICGAGPGAVRVETTDKRALTAALATGQLTPSGAAEPKAACTGVQASDGPDGLYSSLGGGTWNDGGIVNPKIDGMDVERVVIDLVGGARVALGEKEPGTRVPMAALYDAAGLTEERNKATARWLTAIPSVNPLSVKEGAPENGAISRGRLVVPFELQGSDAGWRLACLDVATGRSLWEVPIPGSDSGTMGPIVLSDRQVFLSHWTWLDVFDLGTGAHRMTIGVW
jgi:hypothetical protein